MLIARWLAIHNAYVPSFVCCAEAAAVAQALLHSHSSVNSNPNDPYSIVWNKGVVLHQDPTCLNMMQLILPHVARPWSEYLTTTSASIVHDLGLARAVTFDFHYTYTFDFHYNYVYRQASLICKVLGYLLIWLPLLICIRMTTAACT